MEWSWWFALYVAAGLMICGACLGRARNESEAERVTEAYPIIVLAWPLLALLYVGILLEKLFGVRK